MLAPEFGNFVTFPDRRRQSTCGLCLKSLPLRANAPMNLAEARWPERTHHLLRAGFYRSDAAAHPSLLIICSRCCLFCSLLPPAQIRFDQNQSTNVSVRLPFTVRLHWQIYRQVFLLSLDLPSNSITALLGLPAFTKREQKHSTVLLLKGQKLPFWCLICKIDLTE